MLNLSILQNKKKALREDLVEFTNYYYIQEFLQEWCQVSPKTLILRSLTQNKGFIRFWK